MDGGSGPLKGAATQRRPLALLALLAAAGERGINRDRLLAYLWPESNSERARGSLKQTVYILRRDLGEEQLVLGTASLQLNSAVIGCDLWEFDDAINRGGARQAVALYGGPFLDGFHLSAAPEFERWADAERAQIAERHRTAVEALAATAADSGDHAASIDLWRQLASADPISARAALGYMRALVAAGDRAGALRHARVYESILRAELDAPPDPAVTAFVAALRESPARAHGSVAAGRSHLGRVSGGSSVVGEPEHAASAEHAPRAAADTHPRSSAELPAAPPAPSVPAAAAAPSVPAAAAAATPAATRISDSVRRLRRRSLTGPLVSALLVAIALMYAALWPVLWKRPANAARLPADSRTAIAVLPFAVRGGADVRSLSEGMVDLLSASLDDAGELRSVDSRALLSRLAGRSASALAPQDAATIAGQFGAQLYILGDVSAAGDRLRATALLYDRSAGARPVARASVDGDSRDLFALVDRLAAQLIAARYKSAGSRLTRTAAVTTNSLPAFKAYLDGERHFRAGQYDSAVLAFGRAVEADSGFALAYYRLSGAADWANRLDLARSAADAAYRHRDRLSEPDRLLVQALLAAQRGDYDAAERLYRAVLDDNPDDVEAWFQLGELLVRTNPLRGRSSTEARPALERVIALDSTNGDALIHLARIASIQGRAGEADSLVKRVLARTRERGVLEMRAFRAFALADRDAQKRVTRELMAHPGQLPEVTALRVAVYINDLDGAERFARLLADPARSAGIRSYGHRMLAQTAVARGRWSAAQRELAWAAQLDSIAALEDRALLAALPFVPATQGELEAVRAELERWDATDRPGSPSHSAAHEGLHSLIRLHRLGIVTARLGDATAAQHHAAQLERAALTPDRKTLAHTLAQSVRAHVAASSGRWDEARSALAKARWEATLPILMTEAFDRLTRADALRELGRDEDALGWYAALGERAAYELVYLAPAHLAQAQIYERLGNPARAAEHYHRFVDLWQGCDAALRPQVNDAKQKLAALGR